MQNNELFSAISFAIGMFWLQIRIMFTKPYRTFHGLMGYGCQVYPQLKAVVYTEYDQGMVHRVFKHEGQWFMSGYKGLSSEVGKAFDDYEKEMITKEFEEIVLK